MNSEITKPQYQVIKVEETTAPTGMLGTNWYRYIIKKGNSVIDCKKTGTLKEINEHAKNIAELINARNK